MPAPRPLKVVANPNYKPQGIKPEPVFFPDGIPTGGNTAIAALAAIGVADATDLASAIALANATKARVNEVIAALKATS